jgi:hypothetical protein
LLFLEAQKDACRCSRFAFFCLSGVPSREVVSGTMIATDGTETRVDMYRVADVLTPGFTRSWHEAVAIVQEVASQLVPGAAVPAADDLQLDVDGTLQLGFGPDTVQDPVTALASLLQDLLQGVDAPPGLRDLAADNSKLPPACSSVESFQRALAFYERPVRSNDLQAIVSRLRGGAPPAPAEGEFERLREKVAARAEAEVQPEKRQPNAARRRRGAAAGAVVVALGITAAIAPYARSGALGAPGAWTDRIQQRLADTISGALNHSAGDAAGAEPLPAEAHGGTAGNSPVASGGATRPTAGNASPRGKLARTPIIVPAVSGHSASAVRGPVPSEPFLEIPGIPMVDPSAVLARAGSDGTIEPAGLITYSPADRDVQPPRLSRPQLPREPAPGATTGYFDVIVSELGAVEQVKLVSPARRFEERMLTAAAKAWTFTPARRHGEPVRYRMRIAIILPSQP